jgi:hypothetical protein
MKFGKRFLKSHIAFHGSKQYDHSRALNFRFPYRRKNSSGSITQYDYSRPFNFRFLYRRKSSSGRSTQFGSGKLLLDLANGVILEYGSRGNHDNII